MQLAVKHRGSARDPDQKTSLGRPRRYTVLSQLAGRRGEILVALPEGADTLDRLVVIKTFSPERPGAAPAEIAGELSLASHLEHENITRVLSIGFESGRYFIVSEYLRGTTLQSLLGWARSTEQSIPSAGVVRILLGIIHALDHAAHSGASAEARELINQPVAADDVFITYDGAVKVLGFKAVQRSAPELRLVPQDTVREELPPAPTGGPGAQHAIDALLSSQLTPELGELLARVASPTTTPAEDRVWQVRDALERWLSEEIGGDGRAELAAVMSRVWPEARAGEVAQLQAAFDGVRARKDRTSRHHQRKADGAPVSQYRTRGSAGVKPAGGESTSASRRPSFGIIGAVVVCAALAGSGTIYLVTAGDAPAVPTARVVPTQTPPALLMENAVTRPPATSPPATSPPVPDGAASMVDDGVAPVPVRPASTLRTGKSGRRGASTGAPPGYLTLDTTPWSNVSLGGASLGQTPLVGVEVQPGDHLLELVNSELGITSRYVVNIASGVTTVRRIGLDQPKSRQPEGEP